MKNSTKNKIAFLMPIYETHYDYAKDFLYTFKKHKLDKQADFYFVYSSQKDKENSPFKENSIVIPEEFKNTTREDGIINIKKLYGISYLKNDYDYIIVIDAESIIIKKIDLMQICDEFFNNKILWGMPISDNNNVVPKIFSDSRSFFDEKSKIKDDNLVFWFSNMCIYKSDTLDDFFKVTKLLDNFDKLTFWSFDYYIYMYYLLLYQGFKPKSIILLNAFADVRDNVINLDYINKYMYMCSSEIYDFSNKISRTKKNIFMFIQLDRQSFVNRNITLKILRRLISCFIPNKLLRRKIRGV